MRSFPSSLSKKESLIVLSSELKKRADYILFHKPNLPIALIEAKDNTDSVGAGMQQALAYAEALGIPFIYSSNGDAFPPSKTAPASTSTTSLASPPAPNTSTNSAKPSSTSPLEGK